MKKFIVTTIIAAMMLSLSACSDEAKKTAEDATAVAQGVADAASKDYLYLKDINPADYVTLGQYVGLTPSFEKTEVTDEQIEAYINSLPSQFPDESEITGRPAQLGDIANIDYEGKIDGVAFDGGTAQEYDLNLGSGTFIDGFEDGVVGMEIGSTKDIDLTFPETYGNADLAGKAVVFTVTLNSLKEQIIPELNDEFAQKLGETDLEALRQAVRETYESSAESDYQTRLDDDLEKQVLDSSTFKELPEGFVSRIVDRMMDSLKSYALQSGASEGEIAQYYFGFSKDNYEEELKEYCDQMAKEYIMLAAIAAENNIEVTEEELDQSMQETIAGAGSSMTVEDYKAQLDSLEDYREYVLIVKTIDFIKSKAVLQ